MEYWDLYDKDRNKLNKIHLRGEEIKPGEYHIVVSGWIIDDKNRILLTQRHHQKTFPLTWEGSKGALIAGEDSFTGVLREVEEEIGIKLKGENGHLIDTYMGHNFIKDIYVFNENVNIKDTKLQENEVIGIKWVRLCEYEDMVKEGKMGPSAISDMEIIKNKYKWKNTK